MGKNKKKTRNRTGLQVVTLCISTAMVLILLGMVVLTVFTGRNLSSYAKERLTVTMILAENMTEPEAQNLCEKVTKLPYIASINYVSKEQALKEGTKELGADPSEFAGMNPFTASIELQLKPDYANNDSIAKISRQLQQYTKVSEIDYRQDLINSVNKTLRKISIVLLFLAALLTVVSFSLINNTVRLSVYARRFSIHTMKLVGASWGFIREPFLKRAIGQGFVSALIALVILASGVYGLYQYEPEMGKFLSWEELAITAGTVLLFGVLITTLCAWGSVNKFLRMKAGDLYKI